jgi:hypothetical protein
MAFTRFDTVLAELSTPSISSASRATFRVDTPLITISPKQAASACSEVCHRARHDG